MVETIIHLAVYSSWPNSVTAIAVAQEGVTVSPAGSQTTTAGPSEYFTGTAKFDSRFQHAEPARVGGGIVTFEAARAPHGIPIRWGKPLSSRREAAAFLAPPV